MSTSDDSRRLTPRQLRAIAALAAGGTAADAAKAARCSPATVNVWRRLPAFGAELDRLLTYQRDRVQATLGALFDKARQALEDALQATADGQALHPVRLRAVETILSTFERISKRAEALPLGAAGPLIVLPPGTQRMALAVSTDAEPPPERPALLPALVQDPEPELEPAAEPTGLPRWWRPGFDNPKHLP